MLEFNYYIIEYKSKEGNYRWTEVEVPDYINIDDYINELLYQGFGDDIAEIIDVREI